jgi:hypothetical protein
MKARAAGTTRLFTVEESATREEDWTARKRGGLADAAAPAALDLRADRPWYPVHNQGQTGSCVGWALAESVLRWQLVGAGRLEEDVPLSARFVWMASKEFRAQRLLLAEWQPTTFLDEAFTSAKDALEVVRRYGAVTNRMLPFRGRLNRGPVEAFFEHAAELRITSFHNLDLKTPAGSRRQWRRWLHQHGPVLIVLDVDQSFVDAKGDARVAEYVPRRETLLHACALVGYDEGGFIVRNSWGRRWGEGGDAYLTDAWLERAAKETYGVVI